MPASRPASVPSGTSSQQSSQHCANVQTTVMPAKARKRAKQAAGAGTVLLALFSFVVFLGPFSPMAGPSMQSMSHGRIPQGDTHMVLPDFGSSMDHPMGGGRVLMAAGVENATVASPNSNETQLVLPNNSSFDGQAVLLAEGSDDNGALVNVRHDRGLDTDNVSGKGWWSGLLEAAHVEPSKSIVLRPSNREAESQALQGLKVALTLTLSGMSHCRSVIKH